MTMFEVLHGDKAVRVARVTARAQVVFAGQPAYGALARRCNCLPLELMERDDRAG